MVFALCPTEKIENSKELIIRVECRSCSHGSTSLFDSTCKHNIMHVLSKNPSVKTLILNDALVKVYRDKSLNYLKNLHIISDELTVQYNLHSKKGQQKNSDESRSLLQRLHRLKQLSTTDPIKAFQSLHSLQQKESSFQSIYENIRTKLYDEDVFQKVIDNKKNFYQYLRPYARPGFLDSHLQIEPPPNAVFVTSYWIKKEKNLSARVNLYSSPSTIERLYFLYPPEINLPKQELLLLEQVRKRLSFHRPENTDFLHPKNSKDYFKRFARTMITSILSNKDFSLSPSRIDTLSEIFSQNTSGYGLIEYLLEDENIQDIYINAPVANNPLHLVVNGEEYTSNVFLSEEDVEALASRFRSLSGRPFSEASPVLDMDLPSFHTRVAAINNPLTPKGIAFALRRHRKHPWTLAHFINNNTITPYTAGLLSLLIDGQTSLLIAGSRGAGKTSFLTALINEIPKRFRILTIEDTPEIPILQLQQHGFRIQSLITKPVLSSEQRSELSATNALRTALRLGESVLIVGEVRGAEAKVLFESMRVGAAGNLIMGTIHGSTAQDVYERVVYDIGVPSSSFKAVEAMVLLAPIRREGGFEKHRRVIQISETKKKGFVDTTHPDYLFSDLLVYDTSNDQLQPTDTLMMGQSEILDQIARKWGITIEKVLENIEIRAWIKQQLVSRSKVLPVLLEASCVQDANMMFWSLLESCQQSDNHVDYEYIKEKWMDWFKRYVKKRYHGKQDNMV